MNYSKLENVGNRTSVTEVPLQLLCKLLRLSTVVVWKSNHGKYSACIHFIQTENLQSVKISGNINVYSALNFSFENWLFASLHHLYSTILFPNNTRHFSHLFTLIKKKLWLRNICYLSKVHEFYHFNLIVENIETVLFLPSLCIK